MGEYLAHQISIGKLEYEIVINTYPQYREIIDKYLRKQFNMVVPIVKE